MMRPAGTMSDDHLLTTLVAEGFAPKVQGRHIANHHLAEQMYLARRKLAQSLELPADAIRQITPFPAPPAHHTNTNTTITNDLAPLVSLVERLLERRDAETKPAEPAGKPDAKPAEPAVATPPTKAAEPPAGPIKAAEPLAQWREYLWPAVAAAAVATAGATTWSLWPRQPAPSPPPVTADFQVEIR